MHANPSDKLVMMANQIAKNLTIQGEERAVAEMSSHIKRYWEPRMRQTMEAYVRADGSALDPLALKALQVIWPGITPGKPHVTGAASVATPAPAPAAMTVKKPAAKRRK